jgi:hypothetical protein
MNDITNIEITLTKIHEGTSTISFNPPLKLDCYLVKDGASDQYVNVNFDFGLSYDFGLNPFYIRDEVLSWGERAERIVTFELFHSFVSGHFCDPNFSTLNWALFGNLAHRVTCEERWEFAEDPQVEIWKYNKRLEKVSE